MSRFSPAELNLMHEAMWDNAIDARKADKLGIDFDEMDRRNRAIFERWLSQETGK